MTVKMGDELMATAKVLCGECKKVTNHNVVPEHKTRYDVYDGAIQWWTDYQIVQCKGCECTSFRRLTRCSEDYNPETGKLDEREEIFPEPTSGRTPMEDSDIFPPQTRKTYLETLKALNSQMPLLAAIGLRTLVESICLEKGTKSKNLAGGINELATMGLLSAKQIEFLHKHRFMGNEAAHEIVAPTFMDLVKAMDIAETLLKTIYILPTMASEMESEKENPMNDPKTDTSRPEIYSSNRL